MSTDRSTGGPPEHTGAEANSGTVHRSVALALAAVVVAGLGYGLVQTAVKAAALFTG